MILPNISEFIKKYVTNRKISFFHDDILNNKIELNNEIEAKSILVIGGAGTIGSSFIKAALRYNPSELIVVDTNENGLTELTRTLRSDSNIRVPLNYLTYPMSFSSDVFYKMLKTHGKFDIIANFAALHMQYWQNINSPQVLVLEEMLCLMPKIEKRGVCSPIFIRLKKKMKKTR